VQRKFSHIYGEEEQIKWENIHTEEAEQLKRKSREDGGTEILREETSYPESALLEFIFKSAA
jgi:hypothetical protein